MAAFKKAAPRKCFGHLRAANKKERGKGGKTYDPVVVPLHAKAMMVAAGKVPVHVDDHNQKQYRRNGDISAHPGERQL